MQNKNLSFTFVCYANIFLVGIALSKTVKKVFIFLNVLALIINCRVQDSCTRSSIQFLFIGSTRNTHALYVYVYILYIIYYYIYIQYTNSTRLACYLRILYNIMGFGCWNYLCGDAES